MQATLDRTDTDRYARCIEASKRARWEIDRDVIRGRRIDLAHKFLPDGLSLVARLDFLNEDERRFLSQVQGRTYANLFGLVERFINAKVLELTRDHWFGDQIALESLIRFSDEELKHQELFRRIDELAGEDMPPGYTCVADPDEVAAVVLARSTWSVLALTCHIEHFTLIHYKESIDPDPELAPLFKDVFRFHWKEESQHAVMDELEWRRIDATLTPTARGEAVDDLIALVRALDGILQAQSSSDTEYFAAHCTRPLSPDELATVRAGVLAAYRWQYVLSGAQGRFVELLKELTDEEQFSRVESALAELA